jgi:hypothetical protein
MEPGAELFERRFGHQARYHGFGYPVIRLVGQLVKPVAEPLHCYLSPRADELVWSVQSGGLDGEVEEVYRLGEEPLLESSATRWAKSWIRAVAGVTRALAKKSVLESGFDTLLHASPIGVSLPVHLLSAAAALIKNLRDAYHLRLEDWELEEVLVEAEIGFRSPLPRELAKAFAAAALLPESRYVIEPVDGGTRRLPWFPGVRLWSLQFPWAPSTADEGTQSDPGVAEGVSRGAAEALAAGNVERFSDLVGGTGEFAELLDSWRERHRGLGAWCLKTDEDELLVHLLIEEEIPEQEQWEEVTRFAQALSARASDSIGVEPVILEPRLASPRVGAAADSWVWP